MYCREKQRSLTAVCSLLSTPAVDKAWFYLLQVLLARVETHALTSRSEQSLAAAHLVVRIRLIPGKWMYFARFVPADNKDHHASRSHSTCTESGALENITRKENCDGAADLGRSCMKTTFVPGNPFQISRAMRFRLSTATKAATLSGGTAHLHRSARHTIDCHMNRLD